MSATKEAAKPLPPYVPYKTFHNFIDSLKQGTPGRIDRSVMGTASGAMQNQLLAALRYLHLIDEQGTPTQSLKRLVAAEDGERSQVLRDILEASYSLFLDDSFDLAIATPAQFDEKLKSTGASGDTVRKCAAFFLAAAKEAEIPVSSRITSAPKARSTSKPPRPKPDQPAKKANNHPDRASRPTQQVLPATEFQPLTPSTKIVHLRSGGTVTLTITVDWLEIDEDETAYLLALRKKLREYEKGSRPEGQQDDQE